MKPNALIRCKNIFHQLLPILLLGPVLITPMGCAEAPITGRQQLILISESDEVALGARAFDEVLNNERISNDPVFVDQVNRVGRRIAGVANRPDFSWEFVVIDNDKVINAFALPGGKVAVYTGLLRVAKSDAELAAVMGHEVAHAVARHGAERMSHQLLAQVGQAGLNAAIASQSPATIQAFNLAYGVGVNVGALLPYSRQEESEADHIGLIYMAKAGYDPHAAVSFWERMAKAKSGDSPPEFLSTHPADERRIQNLKRLMPEAMAYYRQSDAQ
jgi:predicted Zn-dependent protease